MGGLRLKVLLVVSFSLLVLFSAASWFIDTRLMHSFFDAQNGDASVQTHIMQSIIARDVESLRVQGIDWSRWDDTYDFMQTSDPAYILSNLNDETFSALEVNVALFFGTDGRVVFGKQAISGEEPTGMQESLVRFLAEDERFQLASLSEKDFSGIVVFDRRPFLLTVQPIVMSDGSGEPRGRLYFGRYLDQGYLDEIGQISGVRLALEPYDGDMTGDFSIAYEVLKDGAEEYVDIDETSNEVNAYSLIRDSSSSPSFVLRVSYPGQIITRGLEESSLFIRSMIGLSVFFAILIFLLAEWVVLRSIFRLKSEVNRIAGGKDAEARVTVRGSDEFASLGKDINVMLDMLQLMTERTKKSESQFEALANIAPVMIWMTDENGAYTYINKSARDFIGDTTGKSSWEERIFVEDKGIRKGLMSEASEAKRPFRLEYRFRNRTGEYLWVSESAVPYIGASGKLVGYLGIVVDIHKDKSMQLETKAFTKELEEMNGLLIAREEKMLEMKNELRKLRGENS